ncbi:MAG TPA: ActS/PrrB/RegB family redox-sensitive histidine kinase [Hellea balneolensis]|uniref:histidine kinase n=1 Tax=Hellea balneolensis TaxID=287478 RepID=A0A7C5QV22_9PROT|nr:ActS/PrrB/RegB family redox-sensitive histidine kinase [Hellea balneolensis]
MAIELEQQTHENLQSDIYQTGRLRRSTLVSLRWMAIAGQIFACIVVYFGLRIDIPLPQIAFVIGLSIIFNTSIRLYSPLDRRISNLECGVQLFFDVLQVSALLYLTGGLENPFSLLLLAPVVVAAKTLSKPVFGLIAVTVMGASLLLLERHLPLPWSDDQSIAFPKLYLIGQWVALQVGMLFTAAYTWHATRQTRRMTTALATTDAILAHEQKLTALGHMAAASAHALGTPLATILVTANEIARNAEEGSELIEDAELLKSQALRCRDILSELSTNTGQKDEFYDVLSLKEFLQEMVHPFQSLGKKINIDLVSSATNDVGPDIHRQPELQYGLTNLIENALDFATSEVSILASWNERRICIDIIDDGPGFDPAVLSKLGEPYVSKRSKEHKQAGGMGLGLFISKTLVERRGGSVEFRNRKDTSGAWVSIGWPYSR